MFHHLPLRAPIISLYLIIQVSVVGLSIRDGRPSDRMYFLLLVPHPLACDVILAVVPRQVVVEQGDCGVGIVLDPLQGGPEVGDEVRWRDVRRR